MLGQYKLSLLWFVIWQTTNLVIFPYHLLLSFLFFVRTILLIPQFRILETFQTHRSASSTPKQRPRVLEILSAAPSFHSPLCSYPLSSSLDDYSGFLLRVFHFFIQWSGSSLKGSWTLPFQNQHRWPHLTNQVHCLGLAHSVLPCGSNIARQFWFWLPLCQHTQLNSFLLSLWAFVPADATAKNVCIVTSCSPKFLSRAFPDSSKQT